MPCTACTTDAEGAFNLKTGDLYVVFGQRETATSRLDVMLKRSSDGGATWAPAVKVNDDTTDREHQFPKIGVAPNGRVDVAWHDWRHDTDFNPSGARPDANYWDVYYSYSNDSGQTWAPEVRMSDRSMHRNEGYSFHRSYGLGGPVGLASTDAAAYCRLG